MLEAGREEGQETNKSGWALNKYPSLWHLFCATLRYKIVVQEDMRPQYGSSYVFMFPLLSPWLEWRDVRPAGTNSQNCQDVSLD